MGAWAVSVSEFQAFWQFQSLLLASNPDLDSGQGDFLLRIDSGKGGVVLGRLEFGLLSAEVWVSRAEDLDFGDRD